MFCKKCGERLEPQDKFCPKCGTLVTYGDASANVSDEKSEEYYSDGNIADIEQTERITRDENYGIDRVPLKQISFLKYLLLSLITFGIYGIYTIYKFTKNVNILCEGDEKKSPNYFVVIFLGIITCGIYTNYWVYKQARRLYEIAPKYMCEIKDNGIKILLWNTFGGWIIIGPVIAWYRLFNNMNQLVVSYNQGTVDSNFQMTEHDQNGKKPIVIIAVFYLLPIILIILLLGIFFLGDLKSGNIDMISGVETNNINSLIESEARETKGGNISETVQNEQDTAASKVTLQDIDFAAYFDGMDKFLKDFPDLLESGPNNLYASDLGVLIQCDSQNVPQYIELNGEAEDSPSFYTIKIGMTNDKAVNKMPGTYELMEADEYGYGYYNPEKHTYIIWFSNEESGRITTLVYLTEEGYDLYWGYGDSSEQYDNSWEYILPDSDWRVYSIEELSYLSDYDIQMAINEIYARHGRRFDDASIQDYFDRKSWYYGYIEPENFSDSVLSEVENENLQILISMRNRSSSSDIVHMELVVLNNTGFDIETMCFREGSNSDWGLAKYPMIYRDCVGGPFPFDVDRNDGSWGVEIRDTYGNYLTFEVDFSNINTSYINEYGGTNMLEFDWEGGNEYSCTLY